MDVLIPDIISHGNPVGIEALLNQGMKKISLTSRSFVDTGCYDWHI
jgi:hypothetical protein